MQQINSYIYDNSVLAQYDVDSEIMQRNRVVYTNTLQIYKGIDNILKIKVQNADQKPVNITGFNLTFNMVEDYVFANATTVLSTNVTIVNANAGLGTVTISSLNMVQLTAEQYNYNVKINNGTANIAAYVDDNYGAAGQIMVSSAAYPVAEPVALDLGTINDSTESAIYDFGNI
jgi:hypothetical protein